MNYIIIQTIAVEIWDKTIHITASIKHKGRFGVFVKKNDIYHIPVNPLPLRGSIPRKSLISRMDWVSHAGDINLPHTPFPPARSPPNKKFVYFLQSPYLFTIDRLFPSIVEMFRINFYRVSLDFSFRNMKLIVVYVIERITTPIRNVHSRRVLFRFSFK